MIITLCGSLRFEPAWHYWNELLTIDGHTVFSVTVMPSVKGDIKDWYSDATKRALDDAHIRKINASEAIFVVTGPHQDVGRRERYIGASTTHEIAHAINTGKWVYYDDHWER